MDQSGFFGSGLFEAAEVIYDWKIAGLTACYFQWNSWKLLSIEQGLKH